MTPEQLDTLLAVNERLFRTALRVKVKPDSLDARRAYVEAQKAWRAFHPVTEEQSA